MIDTSKTVRQLIEEGHGVSVFTATVIQTSAAEPQFIGALDAEIHHQDLLEIRHDVKPWKTARGKDSAKSAAIESKSCLATCVADPAKLLKCIMDEVTVA